MEPGDGRAAGRRADGAAGTGVQFPVLVVERPAEYEALKNLLLTPDRGQPVAITTALAGAGGFGKTTLAAALCQDEDIVENVDDRILWVTLGQTPNVLGSLLTVCAAVKRRAARLLER